MAGALMVVGIRKDDYFMVPYEGAIESRHSQSIDSIRKRRCHFWATPMISLFFGLG
jgi:hypothetical protein